MAQSIESPQLVVPGGLLETKHEAKRSVNALKVGSCQVAERSSDHTLFQDEQPPCPHDRRQHEPGCLPVIHYEVALSRALDTSTATCNHGQHGIWVVVVVGPSGYHAGWSAFRTLEIRVSKGSEDHPPPL